MGSHGDDWYFNGNAELVKEKPVMPENLRDCLNLYDTDFEKDCLMDFCL